MPKRNDLEARDSASRFEAPVIKRSSSHLVLGAVHNEHGSADLIRVIDVRELVAYAGKSEIERDPIRGQQWALKYDAGHASSIAVMQRTCENQVPCGS